LTSVRPRIARSLAGALAATAASILLTACSTSSDTQATFALQNPSPAAATQSANGQDKAEQVAASEDGTPRLPEQIAYAPAAKPVLAKQDDATVAAAADEEAEGKTPEKLAVARPGEAEQLTGSTSTGPAKKKTGFLASLFSANEAEAAPAVVQKAEKIIDPKPEAKPLVKLASLEPAEQSQISRASSSGSYGSDALPGVRQTALFEIKRKDRLDDDSDVDLNEDDELGPIRVASVGGMARLAPNGLLKQTDTVETACLKPGLVTMLRQFERKFGRKVVITSGYRSPTYNMKVGGAKRSQHMNCAAADIQIPGVSKFEIAAFARALPGRGGVGTYCHTESVHVDIGPERDWNWRCRRRKA
jgi:uncharacterized protein YcbK (DUF882 family)